MPRHVAIIMDGNGRWAQQRQLPRVAGHRAGVEAARTVVREAGEQGVRLLTLFAFSSENWRRPEREVRLLMELFMNVLEQEKSGFEESNVRLRIIGDRAGFPEKLQRSIEDAEKATAGNDGMDLIIAANYGGRWDVAQAARALAREALQGAITPEEIDVDAVQTRLSMADLPDPDLFIRTGGEQRISNFLLWHLAYTELYFTDCLWPDFGSKEFDQALLSFASRQRRFGRTSEQVAPARSA